MLKIFSAGACHPRTHPKQEGVLHLNHGREVTVLMKPASGTMLAAAIAALIMASADPAVAFLPMARAPTTAAAQPSRTSSTGGVASSLPTAPAATEDGRGSLRQSPSALHVKKHPKVGGEGRAEPAADDPRRQALDGVLHQIERCYGRGSILKMGDNISMNVETSSTGASAVL